MQILDYQNQCAVGGNGFERVTQLTDHALACGAEHLPLQCLALSGLDERRKLQQPRRRSRRECLDEAPVVRDPDQLVDDLDYRVVRFLAAESFDTLAER